MAGFFKKLFNRIAGKPVEDVANVEDAQIALPKPDDVVVGKAEPVIATKIKPPKTTKKTVILRKAGIKLKPKSEVGKVLKSKPLLPKAETPSLQKSTSNQKLKATPTKSITSAKVLTPKVKSVPPKTTKPHSKPVSLPVQDTPRSIVPVIPAKAIIPRELEPSPIPPDSRFRGKDGEQDLGTDATKSEQLPQTGGWFSRLKDGLTKSSKTITGSITAIFTKRKLDRETLQELEDTLIQADLGIAVSERIIAAVSHGRYDKEVDPEDVKRILAEEVAKVLIPVEVPFNFGSEKPFVILVVGVNGAGKTTTIGKLGSIAAAEGFKVMFAACDTFRAAAVEQLTLWGQRIGAVTKSAPIGADAAGLAFAALKQAQEDGTDILFIDTAGRLQNKTYLMDELDKVVRVIKKMDANAPHAVLLVLDATTGQNALAQAEIFTKVAGVTGLIMTKLDGTARGGILVAIAEKFKLPIHAIGVGESIDDLQPFNAQAFSRAIAGFEN
jgi:fused signal recognition particle receptor